MICVFKLQIYFIYSSLFIVYLVSRSVFFAVVNIFHFFIYHRQKTLSRINELLNNTQTKW